MIRFAKIILSAGLNGLALGLLAFPAAAAQPAVGPAHLPLYFEVAGDQTKGPELFIARGHDYQFLISATGAQMALRKAGAAPAVVRMRFVGASARAQIRSDAELPGKINYFTGSDPAQWRRGLAMFAKVRVEELYPGVNLVYYGNERLLEYDFAIAPGGNPQVIAMHFDGVDAISVNPQGELILRLAGGEIRQPKPVIYQTVDGVRKEITGGYELVDTHTVAFTVGKYDHRQPLVIDPVLGYSTYFGGTAGDTAWAVVVNTLDTNSIFITGQTLSQQLFTNGSPFSSVGAFQTTYNGGKQAGDAFVTKLRINSDKTTTAEYLTYLGGSGDDAAYSIAVDSAGNAFLAGATDSTNFPVKNAIPGHTNISGVLDPIVKLYPSEAFVTELDASGSNLVYSTYLGGSAAEAAYGVAVDVFGHAFVTGFTYSTNFPTTTNALFKRLQCTNSFYFNANAFVTEIASNGGAMVYSTYLGGTNFDQGKGIAVDSSNFVYVTGFTASTNFPNINSFQSFLNGSVKKTANFDAFIAKFDPPNGMNLVFSTFLGGTNNDFASSIAVDTNGAAYVTGWSVSTNFPNTVTNIAELHSFVITNTRASDFATNVFLTKITNGPQAGIAWSTLFGGKGADAGYGVAVDPAGDEVFVTGSASSTNFPVFNVPGLLRATNSGKSDAFVIAFTNGASGPSALLYSAYLGGKDNDFGYGIALDTTNNAYVVGLTLSTNFPTFNPAISFRNGTNDGFLTIVSQIVNPPAIATDSQPISQTNSTGSFMVLSVSVTGTEPFFYHWQFGTNLVGGTDLVDATNLANGTNISGTTNNTLIINPAQTTNTGYYQVIVTNFGGSTTSTIAHLLVTNIPAAITVVLPTNQPVGVGTTATITAFATGTQPLHYQWQKDGTNLVNATGHISGATNATLSFTNIQLASSSSNYTVIVTNANNSVTSSAVVLTVHASPFITVQPAPTNQSIAVGSTATFVVTAIGTLPLRYQWQKDGVNLTNLANRISGATSNVLTISDAQTNNSSSNYTVVVTNIAGSIISSAVVLTVTPVRPTIGLQPTSQLVGAGTNVAFRVFVITGTPPFSYQWQTNGTDLVDDGHFSGTTNTTLTITNAQPGDSGSYSVTVTGPGGSATTNAALTVAAAPVITGQPTPASQIIGAGSNTTYAVTAVGAGTLQFQWQFGTNLVGGTNLVDATNLVNVAGNISGATNNVLNINSALTNNSGYYLVTVTNLFGSVTSSIVALTVTNFPPVITLQPTNRAVPVGSNVTLVVAASGTAPLRYQWQLNGANLVDGGPHGGPSISGATTSQLTINNAQTTNSGSYSVIITNIAGSATSSVVTLTVASSPVIITQPTSQTNKVGVTVAFEVTATGIAPLTYGWQLNGTNLVNQTNLATIISGVTSNRLIISNAQTDNSGTNYTVVVRNIYGSATSSVVVLTVTNIPPTIQVQPTNRAVAAGSNVTLVVVASGTAPLRYQWLEDTNPVAGATNNLLIFANAQATNSGDYSVIITNFGGSVTSAVATLTVTNIPPAILVQPTNRAVAAGSNVTLTVVAIGTAPLTYQWLEGTNPVAAATSNVLAFVNAQPTNSGDYSVIVTNIAGSVTSSVATLTVASSPIILVQPTNQSMAVGLTATLVVTAVGIAPLRYQWLDDTNPVAGATNNLLIFANAQTTNSGSYSVTVTNSAGSVTSSVVTLTVTNIPPAILVQPTNRAVAVGSNVTLVVVATGTAPLNYQWLDGTNLVDGATNNLLTFAGAQTTNSGNYSVTVTNFGGSVTSAVATLTVASSPVFVLQPTDQAVAVGSTATLVAIAVGIAPLSYQWLLDDTNLVDGATNNILTITNAQTTNSGNYSVTVTNSAGSVTSTNALLTVTNVPPTLLMQPTNRSVEMGSNAIFTVFVITGTPPFSYQWQTNGTDLVDDGHFSGTTNTTLTITNAQPGDNGSYSVTVTGPGGSATTNAVLTVVVPAPRFGQIVAAVDGSFILSGTGGVSNGTYSVLISSNLLDPPGLWTLFVTNQSFDGSGNFIFTNSALTNAPQLFYILQMP